MMARALLDTGRRRRRILGAIGAGKDGAGDSGRGIGGRVGPVLEGATTGKGGGAFPPGKDAPGRPAELEVGGGRSGRKRGGGVAAGGGGRATGPAADTGGKGGRVAVFGLSLNLPPSSAMEGTSMGGGGFEMGGTGGSGNR